MSKQNAMGSKTGRSARLTFRISNCTVRLIGPIVLACLGLPRIYAQPLEMPEWGCHVRYDYDAAGNRTDRYWHCWSQDPEGMSLLGNNALRVGPVPTDRELQVSLDSAIVMAKLEVLNGRGELLMEQRWTGARMNVAVDQLASGSYFVRLRVGEEYFIRSFVVAH